MNLYDPTDWESFFVASAGAAAALTGLVFVAVSINIQEILRLPGVPERALASLLLLLGVLFVSLLALLPRQGSAALGVEMLVLGLALLVGVSTAFARTIKGADRTSWKLNRITLAAIGTLPFVIGGLSILTETGGGLLWIVAGVIGAIASAAANAWVLLVEILR